MQPAFEAADAAGGLILAHGVGERGDLPVPFGLALAGAVVALVVSFAVLAFAWRTPRFDPTSAGVPLPAALPRLVDAPAFRVLLQVFGLLVTGYVVVAALAGPDLPVNPTFGVVYVLFWLGLVPASLLFGPIWRYLNPIRTLHRLLSWALQISPTDGLLRLPVWLGYWPAAVGLFAFVWLELVVPDNTTLPVVRLWFAAYAGAHFIAAAVFGSRWFDRGEAFEAYSALFARLSPLGRREEPFRSPGRLLDRRLVLRNPLANLDGVRPVPGLVAVVAVMLGSTAFDGFSGSVTWLRFVQDTSIPATLVGTGALLGFVLVVAVTFWVATVLAGTLTDQPRRVLPGRFASTVVPIALGYTVAHYFTLFVIEGQQTFVRLSDPLWTGANLLGISDWEVNPGIAADPTPVATIKVAAVVVGHVLGVIAAHDRAVRLFPRRTALLGQLPLLVVMIGYTLGGLTLLFAT